MSSTSSTSVIGGLGNHPSPGINRLSQHSTTTTSNNRPFIVIGARIDDPNEISNRQKWLREMIEKAATLITSSPEKKNLADEGLVKYALKKIIVQIEGNAFQHALSAVQEASRLATSTGSSKKSEKKKVNFNPSDLISRYKETIRSVKVARDNRNTAVSKHGDKDKNILEEIKRGRKEIATSLEEAKNAEKLVLASFSANKAEGTEEHVEFLKLAIDYHIDLGLISYGEKDILYNGELVRAQELDDQAKREQTLAEINGRRDKALNELQAAIKKDLNSLLESYMIAMHDFYKTQTVDALKIKISDNKSVHDFLNEQMSSKGRSKELHAAYMANSKRLHEALVILLVPLEKKLVYTARFSLASLRRNADLVKNLIEDLMNESKRLKTGHENPRNIASRLQYEYLQASTRFDEITFSKEQAPSHNDDDDAEATGSEDYAQLRSGFIEILITNEEKKVLENYQTSG